MFLGTIYYPHLSTSFAAKAPVSSLPAMTNGGFSGERLKADQTLTDRSFADDDVRTLSWTVYCKVLGINSTRSNLYIGARKTTQCTIELHLEPRKSFGFQGFPRRKRKVSIWGRRTRGEPYSRETMPTDASRKPTFDFARRLFASPSITTCLTRICESDVRNRPVDYFLAGVFKVLI